MEGDSCTDSNGSERLKLFEVGSDEKHVLRELDAVFWSEYKHSEKAFWNRSRSLASTTSTTATSATAACTYATTVPTDAVSSALFTAASSIPPLANSGVFWIEAKRTFVWLRGFFDRRPSDEESAFRLFYLQRKAAAMAASLLLNAAMLLLLDAFFIPETSLAAYRAPLWVQSSIWLMLTALCLLFLAVYCFAPHWFAQLLDNSFRNSNKDSCSNSSGSNSYSNSSFVGSSSSKSGYHSSRGSSIGSKSNNSNIGSSSNSGRDSRSNGLSIAAVERGILIVWMELGRAVLCVRLLLLLIRIAHYGTVLPIFHSNSSSSSGGIKKVPLCLDALDLPGFGSSGSGSVDDGSFTYMYLRLLIDVSQVFIFASFPFPAPWSPLLCFTELTSQLIRLYSCADRITTEPQLQWLIDRFGTAIVFTIVMVMMPSPLMKERSVRNIFSGLQWQSALVAERKELVHLLVSEVKVPIIELQHMIATIVKKKGISEAELEDAAHKSVHQSEKSVAEGASKSVAFVADMRRSVREAISASDNLLLLLRVQEDDYCFDVERDLLRPLDLVHCALYDEVDSSLQLQQQKQQREAVVLDDSESSLHMRLLVSDDALGASSRSSSSGTSNCRFIPVDVTTTKVTAQTDKFCITAILRELLNASCWSQISSASTVKLLLQKVHLTVDVRSVEVEESDNYSSSNRKKQTHCIEVVVEHRVRCIPSSSNSSSSSGGCIRGDDRCSYSIAPRDVLRGPIMCAKHLVCRRLLHCAQPSTFSAQCWLECTPVSNNSSNNNNSNNNNSNNNSNSGNNNSSSNNKINNNSNNNNSNNNSNSNSGNNSSSSNNSRSYISDGNNRHISNSSNIINNINNNSNSSVSGDHNCSSCESSSSEELLVVRWCFSVPCKVQSTAANTTDDQQLDSKLSNLNDEFVSGSKGSNSSSCRVLLLSEHASNVESIAATLLLGLEASDLIAADIHGSNSRCCCIETFHSEAELRSKLEVQSLSEATSVLTATAAGAIQFTVLAVDSAEQCRRVRAAPCYFTGKVVLFSYNIAFIKDEERRLADLILPVFCEEMDISRLKAWFVSVGKKRKSFCKSISAEQALLQRLSPYSREVTTFSEITAATTATVTTVKVTAVATVAAAVSNKTTDKSIASLSNERSICNDEGYTKWRLLNPTGALAHHSSQLTTILAMGLVLNVIIIFTLEVQPEDAIFNSIPLLIFIFRSRLYRWVLKPLRLQSLSFYWNFCSVATFLVKLVTTVLSLATSPLIPQPSPNLAHFLARKFGDRTGKDFTYSALIRIWVPHILYIPPPYFLATHVMHFIMKSTEFMQVLRSIVGANITFVTLWLLAGTTLHLMLHTYFFEKAYREEYLSLQRRLLSLSYLDTAVQRTLSKLRQPLVVLLQKERTLFDAIVKHVLSHSAALVGKSLLELQAFNCAALQVSVTVTKLEFFDAATSTALCRESSEVCVRDEVLAVLQLLRCAFSTLCTKIELKLQLTVPAVLAMVRINARIFRALLLESCMSAMAVFERHWRSATGAHCINEIRVVVSSSDCTFYTNSFSASVTNAATTATTATASTTNATAAAVSAVGRIQHIVAAAIGSSSDSSCNSTGDSKAIPLKFHQMRQLRVQIFCAGLQNDLTATEERTRGSSAGAVAAVSSTLLKLHEAYCRFEGLSATTAVAAVSNDGVSASGALREFFAFNFPYYLTSNSYLAFSLISDNYVTASAASINTSQQQQQQQQQLQQHVSNVSIIRDTIQANARRLLLRKEFTAAFASKKLRFSDANFAALRSRGLLRSLKFFTTWGSLKKRDVAKYKHNFKRLGWQCEHCVPVQLPSAAVLTAADALLIDSSIEDVRSGALASAAAAASFSRNDNHNCSNNINNINNNNNNNIISHNTDSGGTSCDSYGVGGVMSDDSGASTQWQWQSRLKVLDMVAKARLCGFLGVIVLLVTDDCEYQQLRRNSRAAAMMQQQCSHVDLVLHQPLTEASVRRISAAHDAVVVQRCLQQK